MDDDAFADTRMEERALQPRVAGTVGELLGEVLRVLAVGNGTKDRCSDVNRSPSIALRSLGTTFPGHGDSCHPVLAHRAACRRAARRDGRDRSGREQHEDRAALLEPIPGSPQHEPSPDHGATTTVPLMSGPWIQQKNLYVPGVKK